MACGATTVSGCASTNRFGTPIETFSTATTAAAASFKAIDTQVAAQYTTINEDAAVKAGRVEAASGECQLTSKACAIVYQKRGADLRRLHLLANAKIGRIYKWCRSLCDCSESIEKADASANIQTALNQGLAAISTMAGQLTLQLEWPYLQSKNRWRARRVGPLADIEFFETPGPPNRHTNSRACYSARLSQLLMQKSNLRVRRTSLHLKPRLE